MKSSVVKSRDRGSLCPASSKVHRLPRAEELVRYNEKKQAWEYEVEEDSLWSLRTKRPGDDVGIEDMKRAFLFVARTVSRKEVAETPEANKACQKEWDRLEEIKCWNIKGVREWRPVKREADKLGIKVHIGSVHAICVEKGSELDMDNPDRKYKGRVVFLGDRVKDQHGHYALFEDMSSSPATLEAGKLADFFGCLRAIDLSDSSQGGDPTGSPPRRTLSCNRAMQRRHTARRS